MSAILGQGLDCYVLQATVTNTTPAVSRPTNIKTARAVGYQLVTTSTLAGSWKIEVSNDYVPANSLDADQTATAGTWTDITSAFLPAIAAVTTGGSNQYCQAAPIVARYIRATFTATSGSGVATVIIAGGAY